MKKKLVNKFFIWQVSNIFILKVKRNKALFFLKCIVLTENELNSNREILEELFESSLNIP